MKRRGASYSPHVAARNLPSNLTFRARGSSGREKIHNRERITRTTGLEIRPGRRLVGIGRCARGREWSGRAAPRTTRPAGHHHRRVELLLVAGGIPAVEVSE